MTFPNQDAIATYGGALKDYQAAVDPTTDRSAAQVNQAFATVAMMSALAPRAWAQFTAAATTGAMVLVAHNAGWGNGAGVAPVPARTSLGLYTLTWPTTVSDVIPAGQPGAALTPWTLNIQWARAQSRVIAAPFHVAHCSVTAANVVTVACEVANVLTEATGITFDVWWS